MFYNIRRERGTVVHRPVAIMVVVTGRIEMYIVVIVLVVVVVVVEKARANLATRTERAAGLSSFLYCSDESTVILLFHAE